MYDFINHPSHMNPANNPEMPKPIERVINTSIDSPCDIPNEVRISYCYYMVGGKAHVSMSEIELYPDFQWDLNDQDKEAIDNDLDCEVVFTK